MFSGRLFVLLAAVAALLFGACGADSANADLAAKVQAFDEYPIVWLGEKYDADGDGKPDAITTARTAVSPAFNDPLTGALIKPEFKTFALSYGACDIPAGTTACPIPLSLDFSAPCETPPGLSVSTKRKVNVRGVEAIIDSNGHVRFETADFTLTISPVAASDEEATEKALRIANDLVPANAKAKSVIRGGDFNARPPDLCTDNAGADLTSTATAAAPPSSLPHNALEALQLALPQFTGRGSTIKAVDIESVSYVETTVAAAIRLVGQENRVDPEMLADMRAWMFVAYGSFSNAHTVAQSGIYTTSYAIVREDAPGVYAALTNDRYDLSALGEPVTISRGQSPELDAVRAPEGEPTPP